MTEPMSLETLLAEALDGAGYAWTDSEATAAILATPAGQRLQDVYDKAMEEERSIAEYLEVASAEETAAEAACDQIG